MRVDRYKLGHILVDKDLTASQLAKRAGLSRATISCIKSVTEIFFRNSAPYGVISFCL